MPNNTKLKTSIVYFSKNAQSASIIGPLQTKTGGTFASQHIHSIRYFKKLYPLLSTRYCLSWLGVLNPAYRILKQAKIIASSMGYDNFLDRFSAKKVMLFHGTYRDISPKMISTLKKYDLLLLSGPRQKLLLEKASGGDINHRVIGYIPFETFPKASSENKEKIARELELNSDLQTILYAPARRACGSWLAHAKTIAIQTPLNLNLVMRPHPNQLFHTTKPEKKLLTELKAILKNRQNAILDYGHISFTKLLCLADLLISDATSPTEEALFYDIPQIITESFDRTKWQEIYLNNGISKTHSDKLLNIYGCALSFKKGPFDRWDKAIEHMLENKNQHTQARQDYFEFAFGEKHNHPIQNAIASLEELEQDSCS